MSRKLELTPLVQAQHEGRLTHVRAMHEETLAQVLTEVQKQQEQAIRHLSQQHEQELSGLQKQHQQLTSEQAQRHLHLCAEQSAKHQAACGSLQAHVDLIQQQLEEQHAQQLQEQLAEQHAQHQAELDRVRQQYKEGESALQLQLDSALQVCQLLHPCQHPSLQLRCLRVLGKKTCSVSMQCCCLHAVCCNNTRG